MSSLNTASRENKNPSIKLPPETRRHGSCALQLHGFDQSKPKALYRKFVETSGAVEIEAGRRIVVYLDRRSHNPILREDFR